jgi:Polyketide cyclase / dehydrase and lipid transport
MRLRLFALVTTFGLCAVASAAQVVQSSVMKSTSQSVDAVWQKIGDFCGIAKWHPAVANCVLSADKHTRTLTLKGGGTIVEHLVKWNDATHSYTYTIISGPLPVENYVSTIQVKAAASGSGSEIHWDGRYTPKAGTSDAEAKNTIDGVYNAGVTSLAGG